MKTTLQRLAARKKKNGKSVPLVGPQQVVRNFRINVHEPDQAYIEHNLRTVKECVENAHGWVSIDINLNHEQPNSFENGFMRIDKFDDQTKTITGKRVNRHICCDPYKELPDDYVTLSLNKIYVRSCYDLDGQDKSGDIVIVCISGRGGGNKNGMTKLRDKLRTELTSLYGVNPANILHVQWNKNHNSDPRYQPLTKQITNEINKRSQDPSYLAIIGHSYGGWAACRVSKITKKIPNFVGLIDPVFGPSNTLNPEDLPRGIKKINWFQNNGIQGIRDCPPILRVPCSSRSEGISCGFQGVPGATPNRVRFLRNWDLTTRSVDCSGKTVKLRAYHTNIDDDKGVHREIFDQINSDLKGILGTTKIKRFRKCTNKQCSNRRKRHVIR